MLYAYQDSRGSAWDDTDGIFRDHLFTYPTTSSSIDTLAWEGIREASYDSRYFDALVDQLQERGDAQPGCRGSGTSRRGLSMLRKIKTRSEERRVGKESR